MNTFVQKTLPVVQTVFLQDKSLEMSVSKQRVSVKILLAVATEALSSWLIKTKHVWVGFPQLICRGKKA